MVKTCKHCDLEKDEREFFVNRKTGRLDDMCKSCKALLKKSAEGQALARTKKRRDRQISAADHVQEQLDAESP